MRGKSSSKQGSGKVGGLDVDNSKLDNKQQKEEPHLSGAYIRSLVKQLTSTRTKDPLNSKGHQCLDGGDGISGQHTNKNGDGFCDQTQQSQPNEQPPQHKKQVRRRLHTSRPYQERLLNMAEARREIVTALKCHRAAMKQQQQQQQHHHHHKETELQQQPPLQPIQQLAPEQEGKAKSRRNPRIYASQIPNNFTNYVDNSPCSAFVCPPNNHPSPYPWSLPPVAPPLLPENLNFALPNQTLGLNLNLQDFNKLDSCFYQTMSNPSNFSATSSSSTSSSPPLSAEVPCNDAVISQEVVPPLISANAESSMMNYGDSDLHHAVDDKEMAEIRSIGEQHQMEWNDTLNLVTSACWFKFLKAMEIDPEEKAEEFGHHPFDEVMEFPSWLNANESCLEQHLSDYCTDDYMQDPALPCMEIEEIEGMDGEWLS
ncbi:OLC1v1030306C1 [Oldenlandia corymbosa var. corymbosa]|uniref:OLC1v1030306C1 n=1 Tax=Oldenlandia corymbosa var. corymbosa TaxID=529605 RepID=A0AAV1CGJ0_OLDCO|nr:OLC1v1030306C1 [Oldenlandia corymbosa var. corymbosa]